MIRYVARIGYTFLALLVLQVLSLAVITLLQHAIFDHIRPQTTVPDKGDHLLYVYGAPLTSIQPDKEKAWIVASLWIALVIVVFLTVIYLSNITSALLKRILRDLYGRLTLTNLFAAKFIVPGVSYIIISLLAMLLPAIYLILPINAVIALICLLCFGIQYRHVHRHKIPISKIL